MGPSPDTASDAASDATFEEATVLNLPVDGESPEAEPVAPLPPARQRPGQGEFQPSLPRPASGLGARLRRLARRDATDGEERARPEATPDAADRTVAVPIAPAADPEEVEAPEARASAAEARAPSEPEPVETPLASDRVPLVIDSAEGSVSLEVEPGCTVLEAVQQAGLERGRPVDWECGDGGCGVCIVGVVEGADRMDPPDPASGEMQTIQITEQVAPDPTRYRLACLARVRGAVRLRKLT
jgi:ferredoxin